MAPSSMLRSRSSSLSTSTEAAQALVADGDPVRVAAEVVEDLFGAGERRLGVGGGRCRPTLAAR